jgi:hypothetical protein
VSNEDLAPQRMLDGLRILLWSIFGVFAFLLLARAFDGGFAARLLAIRSPLNLESFVAVSFLLLAILRSNRHLLTHEYGEEANVKQQTALNAAVILLCMVAFAHSLGKPLLFDDYGHIAFTSQSNWAQTLAAFYRPHADPFFRPVGYLSYFIDFHWAHFNPFRWHLWSLTIHIANCVLVYVLARRLEFSPVPSAIAGALFAIHGARAEPVCWTDARFDLLSTLFVLLALISLEHYIHSAGKRTPLILAYLFSVIAMCTKESAFAIPLMLIPMSVFHKGEYGRRLMRLVPAMFILACATFVYRLWMIRGVGGYQINGHPNVFTFSAIRSAKGLLWRLWGLSFFPINWDAQPNITVAIMMSLFILLFAIIAFRVRLNRARLLGALVMILLSSLTVEHLLLIGTDLAGARILYLPFLGLAFLWAVVYEACVTDKLLARAVPIVVLSFNLTCLESNISTWTQVAEASRSTCETFGHEIANVPGHITVLDIPVKHRGVYFLQNGFPNCVEINSGVAAGRILTDGDTSPSSRTYRWNWQSFRFEQVHDLNR